MPSKLIDYFGAGSPILAITPSGTTADLVKEYGGAVASPFDADDVAVKLTQEISDIKKNNKSVKINHHFCNKYHAKEVAMIFEGLIFEMVSSKDIVRE
jgi:ribosomal protein L11 methylase PrmA